MDRLYYFFNDYYWSVATNADSANLAPFGDFSGDDRIEGRPGFGVNRDYLMFKPLLPSDQYHHLIAQYPPHRHHAPAIALFFPNQLGE